LIGTIPITTPIRTLFDIAAVFDEGPLIRVVHDALRRGLTTTERLMRTLSQDLSGRPGIAELRRILREGLDSFLERRLKEHLDASSFRHYVPQHEVLTHKGQFFIDFAFVQELLAVEADGFAFHSDPLAFQRDRVKWRELQKLGWTVLPFTYEEIRFNPQEVINDIAAALANNTVPKNANAFNL
jgi:very-short-patch-repair endonuclease